MTNLLEIVFEGINKGYIIQTLIRLISDAKCIVGVECTENTELMYDGKLNMKALESALNFNGDVSILIKLQDMKAGNAILPSVLLRLVKYDDQFDIDFNFDASELKNLEVTLLMKYLHIYAKEIARDFNIENFFGGMEPASDKSTRYFTNQIVGSLR